MHVASASAKETAMEWVILEALVAAAIGLAIVWWTLSPARRRERDREERESREADGAAGTAEEREGKRGQ